MATSRSRSPLLPAVLLAAACAAPNTALDLARNERLYVDVPFATRVPGDREVFVAPLADVRTTANLPTDDRGFPITYGSDEVWERPVRDMVDEVLARQLEQSHLFTAVSPRVTKESLVLTPALVSFTTGAIENVSGARSFAEVALRVRVLGPAAADGEREVLHDVVYADRKITEPSLSPPSPYLLVGAALQTAMQKALSGLDGSNVGRSHLPAGFAVPASAPFQR